MCNFEISRGFLPPILHGKKKGTFHFFVEIAHKAVVLILLSLKGSDKRQDRRCCFVCLNLCHQLNQAVRYLAFR